MATKKLSAEEATEKALNPTTFNIVQYLNTKTAYTDTVVIYIDVENARKLKELKDKLESQNINNSRFNEEGVNTSLSITESSDVEDIEAEIKKIEKQLESSALKFNLQSIPPSMSHATRTKISNLDRNDFKSEEEYTNEIKNTLAQLYVTAIVDVTTGDGSQTFDTITAETLLELEENLYKEQGEKLVTALDKMMDIGTLFEESITPDFL